MTHIILTLGRVVTGVVRVGYLRVVNKAQNPEAEACNSGLELSELLRVLCVGVPTN